VTATDPYRLNAAQRPRYRGVLHTWAFVVSVPAAIVLAATAPGGAPRFAAAVFGFSVSFMLGTSALFHRFDYSDEGWHSMRRLDHLAITLCIAGGYTPIALVAVDGWQRTLLLLAGWGGAAMGIVARWLVAHPPRGMMNTLFISLGWVSVICVPAMYDGIGGTGLVLIGIGGLLYTLGALVVGARWPDPWPATFGYHEIWHVFVVVAVAFHYAAMGWYVLR